jgi:hypothetical protein
MKSNFIMNMNAMFSLRAGLLLSTCLLLSHVASFAQEPEQIKVRFVSFPKSDNPQPVELLIGDGKTIPVDLPTNVISQVYTIKKPAQWTLGKSVTDAKGNPSFQVYGTAPALVGAEQLVLCIRKGKSDSDGFTLVPFAEGPNAFGGGKYIFFNATKIDIACTIGETKLAIKPLDHKLIAPVPIADENNKKLLLVNLFFRKQDEAEPFYSSQWRFSEKARTMVILYHEDDEMRIKMHMIRDYIP